MTCPNRIDPDDPESQPCGDEGRLCPQCWRREHDRWVAYFWLSEGMSREERRRQIEAFRPVNRQPDA
jgi:hypothetical protein